MTEKINELKSLIETLAEDSPLRKQLQDALDAELARKKAATENTEAQAADKAEESDKDFKEESKSTLDELKELDEKLDEMLKELDDEPSGITGKLEKLMEDDEFITAAAGFVLGAAAVGLGALAFSALKKK